MTPRREAELLAVVLRCRGRVLTAAGLDPRGRELGDTAAAALADLAEHLERVAEERQGVKR